MRTEPVPGTAHPPSPSAAATGEDAPPTAPADGVAPVGDAAPADRPPAGTAAGEGSADGAAAPATPRRRRLGVLLSVAALVYVLDVVSKVVVVAELSDRAPIRMLGGLLTLRMDRNPGAAFSIGVNMTIVFTVVAVVVAVVILRVSRRLSSIPWAVALGMLLGGALGNLTDRVFRHPGVFRGQVVDFIELPHWPVFNLADSGIVLGGCLMVLLTFRGIQPDGTVHRG